ncbi:MAG: nucleoside monophosphate kinase [Patescibacteria group bacterium]
MKYLDEFPIFSTKTPGVTQTFDLSTPEGRAAYFTAKVGKEIAALKKYFQEHTFVAYLLAKKSAGKGTYTKLMREIFGSVIAHISVGDVVRATHRIFEDESEHATRAEVMEYLEKHYRGYMPLSDAVNALLGRDTASLLPTEFILALVMREIDALPRSALFLDGFPREIDQVSYALFFRNLVDYRNDPDLFLTIDIPMSVIDERMKYRVVCPVCQTPRSLKLLTTREVGYDEGTHEFFLLCDEHKVRMVQKEGDTAGIAPIRGRLEKDQELIDKMFGLHGIPRILIRNAIPADKALEYVDQYELTPEYQYEWDAGNKKVVTKELPWTVEDDEGVKVYSLLAPAAVVALLKQLVAVLKISV